MVRRRISSTVAAAVAASAAVVAAAGCGGGAVAPATPQHLGHGGTLTVGVSAETSGYNPYINSWSESGEIVASAFYESLTAIGRDGKVHPYLASKVTASDDLKTYTIKLRPGIRFHDDTPMDAKAVVYDLRQDALDTSPHGTTLGGMRSIRAIGPLTVQVRLSRPRSDFAAALASDGAAIASAKAGRDPDRLNGHPVGTGPFRFVSWNRDDRLVVERNPSWWRRHGGPALDRVIFRPIPDPQSRFDSLRSGQLDVAYLDAGRQLAQARAAGLPGEVFLPSSVNALALNVARAPFDNLHARRAVALALDRRAVAKVDESKPADQLFAVGNPNHLAGVGYPAFDLAAARREAAAYTRETGRPLSFSLACIPGAAFSQLTQLEQAMLQKAGMHVTLKSQDFSSFVQTVFGGDYQAGCWRTDPIDNPNVVFGYSLQPTRFGGDGSKKTGYANATNFWRPEIQRLLKRSGASADPAVQRASWQQISRILATQLPYAITDYTAVGFFRRPGIAAVPTSLPDGAPSGTISQSLSIKNIDWTGYGRP